MSSSTPDFLKTLTYPRPDLTSSILSCTPPPPIAPRTPRASASLGALDTLPLELLHDIVHALPLSALSPLLSTSSSTHSLLLSDPLYRNLRAHAAHALHAYSATALGASITVAQLSAALCTERCAHCGEFGPFLWMLDCTRCCWACLTQHPDLLPLAPEEAMRLYGIPGGRAAELPVMRSVPGVYRTWKEACVEPESRRLVSRAAAMRVAVAVHGSAEKVGEYVAARAQKGVSDSKDMDVRRLLGVIALPTVDRRAGVVEHGVSCKGCTSTLPVVALRGEGMPCMPVRIGSGLEGFDARKRELGRMFTAQGYLAHYQVCGRARELWEWEMEMNDDEEEEEDEEEWDMEEADRSSPFL
ncbi:uncharacterized protein H6S33_009464 [Morchella sextelata]|uniref:uncharacterized protein n=1 Tax=Morchella sextelata TaxID=1174677 RepID=UPI001D053FD8|nr:uncharacterized protein H6S33_009464 [Morchella sextelata]KAH0613084.1 hypothetical protein H6S33_009464 [Morchella sextelata]